jgi:predicted short-subunit dehydrogenase-like oxidoreductase (DUF2520 family)
VRVGFVGAGKAGCSFGKLIAECVKDSGTLSLAGYFSRSRESADYAAELTDSRVYGSARELLADSDIIFLTVPDGAIAEVWNGLREYNDADGKLFCHMSGSLTSAVFGAAAELNMSTKNVENGCGSSSKTLDANNRAIFGSLHPMLAIADKETSWRRLAVAHYTFDGSDKAYERVTPLIEALGLRAERIDADNKILYHAACVFASNLVCALAYDAEKLLRNCGLTEEFASEAWKTLFIGNAENIVKTDPVTALTGPVERGDTSTVAGHLDALVSSQELYSTYAALTKTLSEMAEIKHPERKGESK